MRRWAEISILLAFMALGLQATPIPGLVSTGTAAPGSPDPAWQVFYSAVPVGSGFSFTSANVTDDSGYPFPYWVANNSTSRWISPQAGYGTPFGVYDDPVGYYYFLLQFNLGPGYVPSTGTFTFRMSVDNWLNSVWLNGTYIGTGYEGDFVMSHTTWTDPITVGPGPTSGLVPGLNNLVVVVYNKDVVGGTNPANPGTWNPAGLRFEILESDILYIPPPPPNGEIPEPGTLLMLGSGLLAVGLMKFRRSS